MNEENYWKRKVEDIAKISKECGYPYNSDFWMRQPAGVISLIIDIRASQPAVEADAQKACHCCSLNTGDNFCANCGRDLRTA